MKKKKKRVKDEIGIVPCELHVHTTIKFEINVHIHISIVEYRLFAIIQLSVIQS